MLCGPEKHCVFAFYEAAGTLQLGSRQGASWAAHSGHLSTPPHTCLLPISLSSSLTLHHPRDTQPLHHRRINTLHLAPSSASPGAGPGLLLTSSSDTRVSVWDARVLSSSSSSSTSPSAASGGSKKKASAKPLAEAQHQKACQAAYWEPGGAQVGCSTVQYVALLACKLWNALFRPLLIATHALLSPHLRDPPNHFPTAASAAHLH